MQICIQVPVYKPMHYSCIYAQYLARKITICEPRLSSQEERSIIASNTLVFDVYEYVTPSV